MEELLPLLGRLSHTNDVPSDAARRTIITKLPRAESHVQSRLPEEIITKEDIVGTARQVLHPIRKVTDDILVEIFTICQDLDLLCLELPRQEESYVSWEPSSSCFSTEAPWTFSHVCRLWRRAALSCPSLWRVVRMESIFRSENIEAVSHNLALQLKRSGDQPNLIVSFDVPGTETRSFSGLKIYRDLFYLPLVQLSHRWESLHITLSRYRSVEFVQKYLTPHIEGYLPSLHSLRVDLMRAGEQDVFPIDAFKFAPVLRKLIINTPDVENFPFFLHLPWAQLTSYHGSTVRDIEPVARPRQVVRRMPNLETLFEERMYVNETRPSLIRLDFLHTLALVMTMPSGVDHNAISEYFDLLSLPRLRDLRLELKHYHWSQSMAAISRFFARSTSTIRSLWLELDGAYEMSSLFIQVPHLDSLSLASVSAEVIDTLAEIDLHRNQPRFLPQLCHLSMFSKADAYYNPEDYMEESLIRFAKCRQNSTELVLDSFIKIRKESLDLMRAEGLHVRIENLAWAQTFRAF